MTATMLAVLLTGRAPRSPAVEKVAEVVLVALGLAHVEPAQGDDLREGDGGEQDPGQRNPEDVDVGDAGEGSEDQRQQAERHGQNEQDREGQTELAAHERGDVDLPEARLLVDLGGDRDVPGARGGRAGLVTRTRAPGGSGASRATTSERLGTSDEEVAERARVTAAHDELVAADDDRGASALGAPLGDVAQRDE